MKSDIFEYFFIAGIHQVLLTSASGPKKCADLMIPLAHVQKEALALSCEKNR